MAPRLLDKRIVSAEVATEKKQLIDRGITMAKKVDAVRDTLQEEEQKLESFRSETLRRVQLEIDAKLHERDSLERENTNLREDRIRLSAPIDLSQAWSEVKEREIRMDEWNERLTNDSISLLAKEEDVRETKENLRIVSENVLRKDSLLERTLTEAETKLTQASDILERAKRDSEKMLKEARDAENHIRVRESDATEREQYLSKREDEVLRHEVDLASREKKLRSRQELFMKAQNYLKNKKQL